QEGHEADREHDISQSTAASSNHVSEPWRLLNLNRHWRFIISRRIHYRTRAFFNFAGLSTNFAQRLPKFSGVSWQCRGEGNRPAIKKISEAAEQSEHQNYGQQSASGTRNP